MSELRALLVAAETDETLQTELFQNVRAPTVRTAYFRGLDKTLHNALAGAVSLVDHTRRHVAENFPETDFSKEFEGNNSTVYEMPESAFLRRFRNYLLHVGHAPFKMTGTLAVKNDDKGTLTVWLISEELLSAENFWTAPARKFIEDHPDGIHLLAVVSVSGIARRLHQSMQYVGLLTSVSLVRSPLALVAGGSSGSVTAIFGVEHQRRSTACAWASAHPSRSSPDDRTTPRGQRQIVDRPRTMGAADVTIGCATAPRITPGP